jgi:transcriptional regulator with XRE-family HTH domain
MEGQHTEEIKVGESIRATREERGLSLKDLADLTGFSTALLSQMENHLVSPSLGTIITISRALKLPLGHFFGKASRQPYSIVRKDKRKKVSRFASKEGVNYGYSYESLGYDKKNRHMEPFLVTLEPATVKTQTLSTHEGEEFIYVLEGDMEVILGKHTDLLQPGDSIYYDSTIPHRVQCHEDRPTKILAVLYTAETQSRE